MKRSSLRGRVAVFLSAILLALTLSVSVLPAPAFAASSVVINPTQGAVGTQVTGTGNSWTAGHTVNVTLENGTTLGSTTVKSDGTFAVSFTIPTNVPQGSLSIDFADGTGNLGFFIPVTFTVTAGTAPSVSAPVTTPAPSSTQTTTTQQLPTQVGHPFQPSLDLSNTQQPPSAQLNPDLSNPQQTTPKIVTSSSTTVNYVCDGFTGKANTVCNDVADAIGGVGKGACLEPESSACQTVKNKLGNAFCILQGTEGAVACPQEIKESIGKTLLDEGTCKLGIFELTKIPTVGKLLEKGVAPTEPFTCGIINAVKEVSGR